MRGGCAISALHPVLRCMARAGFWGAALATLMLAPLPAMAVPKETALLRGLDKITARVTTFAAPVDEISRFGTLAIRVRHCERTPPEEAPEATAFLEIDEVKADEEPALLFTGWMFASSPGVNALEHPVYDVWVLDCHGDLPQAAAEETPLPESVLIPPSLDMP